jgi:hypothetical protein
MDDKRCPFSMAFFIVISKILLQTWGGHGLFLKRRQ